jgi:hypothetical protein
MIIEDEVKMKNPQLCFVFVECPIGYVLNWGQGPKEIFFSSPTSIQNGALMNHVNSL